MNDKILYDIVEEFGLPRELCSCPGCGRIYGFKNRKVCKNCEECEKCCTCNKKKLVDAHKFVSESNL